MKKIVSASVVLVLALVGFGLVHHRGARPSDPVSPSIQVQEVVFEPEVIVAYQADDADSAG